MFPPRTIRSIVTCALACGLLATSSAGARPIDDARGAAPTSGLAGTTASGQDLRSPDARDAASAELIAHQMMLRRRRVAI